MPKVKYLKPPLQQQLEDDLRSRYGGMMDAKHVGIELSINDYKTYKLWLEDVPFVLVGKRKKWRVADVAEKIYRSIDIEKGA